MVYLLTNLLVFVRVLGWDFKGLNLYNNSAVVVVKWLKAHWKAPLEFPSDGADGG